MSHVWAGEAVGSAGFPFFSSRYPTITRGNVSGASKCMLQTTCCIQSGSSGGPIVRWSTGEMLGMVVCNALSTTKSKIYPRLNMAVPVSVLDRPLREYLRTGRMYTISVQCNDPTQFPNNKLFALSETRVLEILDSDDPTVSQTWNFHHLPSSKIWNVHNRWNFVTTRNCQYFIHHLQFYNLFEDYWWNLWCSRYWLTWSFSNELLVSATEKFKIKKIYTYMYTKKVWNKCKPIKFLCEAKFCKYLFLCLYNVISCQTLDVTLFI